MNIAIINQSGGKYLFEVPESITLKEGEKVKCDTRRGVTEGVCYADSVIVDEPIAMLIGKLTGAKFPLKKVVGKMEYQPFEKPTEDKPEPEYLNMKVICVAANGSGWFTTGNVYEVRNGVLNDDGGKFNYNPGTPARTLEQLNVERVPKFVEFKGE
jgi:hypothetical protein